jgi:phosphoribosyl-ATP pyrophosphohydrolase
MTSLTVLLRDRDSTNSKRLRISADKEMAKKSGEEALEIAKAQGQIVSGCGGDSKKLFSENLY